MKSSHTTTVLANRVTGHEHGATGADYPNSLYKSSIAARRGADACKDVVSIAQVEPQWSSDHWWIAMRDFATRNGEKCLQRRTVAPSRLWRQNYYLSALEAVGIASFGRRELIWHLDDIARQLGETRAPHPSTVQRWRRQILMSRQEAFKRQAYFDRIHQNHVSRRHSWEAA